MQECTLELSEIPLHLYQITAGFFLLEKSGRIKLRIKRLCAADPKSLPYNMLRVNVGGRSLIYDMNDGYDNLVKDGERFEELYDRLLEGCDFMFKRSFNAKMNARLQEPHKIKKTAPNFFVTTRGNPAHFPAPSDPRREKIKKLVRLLPFSEFYNGWCYEEEFRAEPVVNDEPKALFMARLWDPAGEFPGQLTEEKSEERRMINESRAECVRLCRAEFGERFFGGITPSPFAQREYSDVLLEDMSIGKKNEYLKHMKSFDIHIATMGLHRSTGWKFAEYLAASKAIVSEPLFYESAGGLSEGKNYISFDSPLECVEKIYELFDGDRRLLMMENNRRYRDKHMACETIAAETLARAGVL
ncbi:MAG: glycosyltransferase family 1 protein [Clostridiales bacterium]|jgi:hypothetical protein|nr:glycosyltransferase family 1 protein [Clostridiales bacterium]